LYFGFEYNCLFRLCGDVKALVSRYAEAIKGPIAALAFASIIYIENAFGAYIIRKYNISCGLWAQINTGWKYFNSVYKLYQ
jgi:hypothetical protein